MVRASASASGAYDMDDIDPIAPHQPATFRVGRRNVTAIAARPLVTIALALATASVSRTAPAQDVPAETITGDWGGLRTHLHERGIDLLLSYMSNILQN
jgi:carbohydrate-selective porin OprB